MPDGAGSGSFAPLPAVASPPTAATRSARKLSVVATVLGLALIVLGFSSAAFGARELYRDAFSGYDPPFAVVSGMLLIVLAPRVRERSALAWLVSLLAPVLTGSAAIASPNVYSLASAGGAVVFVAAFYPYRSGFYRGATAARPATELGVIVAGLLSLLFGTVGARELGDDFTPALHGWADSLYFTVTTISTNGSGIEPTTSAARLFVVGLILLGVGTFLSAIVVLFVPFVERRLSGLSQRLERAQMQELEQHVIVCGASPEAHATARALRTAGAPSVILSTDSQALELLRTEGFRTHLGDPSVEADLRAVGIDRARAVIVAQATDAENLLAVITARALQPAVRIVAIASSDNTLPKLRRAGANEAVSVVGVAAALMSSAALENSPRDGRDRRSAPG